MLSEARLLDRLEGSVFVHSFVVADLAQHIGDRLERAVVGGERDVIGFCIPLRILRDEGHVLVLGPSLCRAVRFHLPFIGNSIDRNSIE